MTEETKIKPGPKWTNDKVFSTHLEALTRVEKLILDWKNKKQESMQTKIRLKSDGRYLVKFRKEPTNIEKEMKDGNRNRKNKRTTSSPKFNADASV